MATPARPWTATAEDYVAALRALLPRGAAWVISPDSRVARFVLGLSRELVRAHAFVASLPGELIPNESTGLLAAWESALGLPEPGEILAATTADRRLDALAKFAAGATVTEAQWIALAAAAGWPGTTIGHGYDEVATCEGTCEALVGGDRWAAFAWYLLIPSYTTDAPFEALCQKIRPANTLLMIEAAP
jgi:uncharacterized protein YmfQ (DUF2313 family)